MRGTWSDGSIVTVGYNTLIVGGKVVIGLVPAAIRLLVSDRV